jgi:HSP20 family protein
MQMKEEIMASKSTVPVTKERSILPRFEGFPLASLQREIDRLFEDFSHGFGRLGGFKSGELVPSMNVSETDGEIEFTAELPGMEEKDVEVTLADNILTIRGEKKAEKEEKEKDYRLLERTFGSFSRSFEVPSGIEPSAVKATIDKGVLTVKFPKPAQPEAKKIDVNAAA